MHAHLFIADSLATSFLSGAQDLQSLCDRGTILLGKRHKWLRPLASRYLQTLDQSPPHPVIVRFLLADEGFLNACRRNRLKLVQPVVEIEAMRPHAIARDWQVPPLCSPGALADWLEISTGDLEWLANLETPKARKSSTRSHYTYTLHSKKFGRARLIEAPKPMLKAVQSRVLHRLLHVVAPHDAAHGFRKDRSIRTFASPHQAQDIVLRFDLNDFFPSITFPRVYAIFAFLGYPVSVARLLTGLCTNSAPTSVCAIPPQDANRIPVDIAPCYGRRHLPQGAPTSPALANLCAHRFDRRLAGLAHSVDAHYTRYADDLAFSGGATLARSASRFRHQVAAILWEEGFEVHHRKTRIMRRGVRQGLAGLVVNERLNIRRDDFDRLRAILTNCVRLGPESQNRDGVDDFRASLQGKISYVAMIHEAKGEKLRRLFDAIKW
jgi:retron-type reverse transcriptase